MDNLTGRVILTDKRLSKSQVRNLLNNILRNGGDVEFTEYCQKRMLERGITAPTVINVFERGIVQDGEEYTLCG